MILASLAATDPNTLGICVTALIGSLGAAGAAVAVTYYFLAFLRSEGEKQDRIFSEFRDYHAGSQKRFQDQLDRLADRQASLIAELRGAIAEQRRSFREELRLQAGENRHLTREALALLKSLERAIERL